MMDWDNCDAAYDFEMEQRAIEADAMKLNNRLNILGAAKFQLEAQIEKYDKRIEYAVTKFLNMPILDGNNSVKSREKQRAHVERLCDARASVKEKIVEVDCWIKEMRGERND